MNVEEEHPDVLQSIEFAVIDVCRRNPDLVDFDVERVYEALIKHCSRPGGASPEFPTEERSLLCARQRDVPRAPGCGIRRTSGRP